MRVHSLGDLAWKHQIQRDTVQVNRDLARLTHELSSGVRSDVSEFLRGDLSKLSLLETDLTRLEGYKRNIDDYKLLLDSQQSVLTKLRDLSTVSATFLTMPAESKIIAIDAIAAEGLTAFEASLRSLNVQVGGRAIFSGIRSNQPAVASSESVLAAIEAELVTAAAANANDVVSVVSSWFESGGGYETVGYTGGIMATTDMRLSDSEVGKPAITAEATAIREHLAALTLSSLVARNQFPLDHLEKTQLIQISGEKLISANELLVNLQATIGQSQGVIERATAEVSAQENAFLIAKAELIEVDAFESATELQRAEIRLQSIYTITSRLARLNLAEYL